ncbi:MAG: hypothetical protein IKL13_06955 [Clostridia bacterium]|nr:hypothetical protein [Clostridia bacterium]
MTKRRITCLCLALLLLMPMLLSGCGKKAEKALASYTENSGSRVEAADSRVENDKYALVWSDASNRFALQLKTTGEWFYSAPMDIGLEDDGSAPVIVSYIQPDAQSTTTVYGSKDCLALDTEEIKTYSSERIENGFRAVYSFVDAQIAVTVEYLLGDNGLEIRIPVDGLQENDNRIVEIKLAPFMASVGNNNGSYMMVPSGSGALIYAERSSKVKEYYEAVYGGDASEPLNSQKRIQSQVYLPVFGTMNKGNNTGMVGIIEGGADCAMIYAQTGGTTDYSAAYTSFLIRSKEKVVYNETGHSKQTGTRYSDTVTSDEYLSVRYIPLSANGGDDITYNGMAKCYRDYLLGRGYLQSRPESTPALSVNILGSTQITESLFGVPYQSDVAVTTLEQTRKIVSELKELLGDKGMLVTLEGYGQGGLANTEIGGGFKLSGTVGNKKDLAALVAYAEENGIVLSMDYELAQFQNSGSGIQVGQDSVMCMSTLKAQLYTYNMSTGLAKDQDLIWYLLTRGQLTTVMDKAIASVNKHNIGALSIGSLNRLVYSDFRTEGYAAMSYFGRDVEALLQKASENGLLVVADDANAYVAINADYVTEVPMHSTRFSIFDEDIPFYSLVFQGYVPMTTAAINMAVNPCDTYLQAVATGMTLQFTLCDSLHESTQFDADTAFVSSRYVDWKDEIAAMVEESADLYNKVGNQSIVRYEREGDVSVTEFENGLIVYVNYADEAVTYDGIELAANSFIYR